MTRDRICWPKEFSHCQRSRRDARCTRRGGRQFLWSSVVLSQRVNVLYCPETLIRSLLVCPRRFPGVVLSVKSSTSVASFQRDWF